MNKETLEEAANRIYPNSDDRALRSTFKHGARWQAERMYSKEDIIKLYYEWVDFDVRQESFAAKDDLSFEEWLNRK